MTGRAGKGEWAGRAGARLGAEAGCSQTLGATERAGTCDGREKVLCWAGNPFGDTGCSQTPGGAGRAGAFAQVGP